MGLFTERRYYMYSLILLLINLIFVILIAYLDAPNEILSHIMNWLSKGKIKRVELKKPLGCPLCMTFWCSWLVSLIILPFTLKWFLVGLFASLLNAILTKYTLYIIETLDLAIIKLLSWLQQKLK